MDEVTFKNIVVKELLKFLKLGNYVKCTNLYTGNYYDGENSDDKKYLVEDNIMFVPNMPEIRYFNKDNKTVNVKMHRVVVDIVNMPLIKCNIGIHCPHKWSANKDDWKIFVHIPAVKEVL
jgi:hypothetical protein